MMASRLVSLLLLAAAATRTAPAAGQAVTEPIRIEYRADPRLRCPSERAFTAQVFSRTKSARPARGEEAARAFVIRLTRHGARVAGSLVIQERDGATMARRVRGASCADVATVLALATALAIDPRAELAPREPLEPMDGSASRAEGEGGAAQSDGLGSGRPSDVGSPDAEEWQGTGPEWESDEYSQETGDWQMGYGPSWGWGSRWALGASLALGVAPRPAYGASLLLALTRPEPGFVSSFGLEFAYRRTASVFVNEARAADDARATFHFFVVRPTLCLFRFELGATGSVEPCAVFEVGGITGVGAEIPTSRTRTKNWAAAEGLLRGALGLGADWSLTLDAGIAAPLTRYQFVFENPDTSIHRVPAVSGVVALRVGRSF